MGVIRRVAGLAYMEPAQLRIKSRPRMIALPVDGWWCYWARCSQSPSISPATLKEPASSARGHLR